MKSARLRLLLLTFVVAFSLRATLAAVFVGLSSPPDEGSTVDQVEYENNAYNLSQGLGYVTSIGHPTAYRPPGTSFMIAPIYFALGRSYFAARIGFCILSALTCVVLYLVGEQLWDWRIGAVAAFWLTFYPGHFYHAMHFMSETPYTLFLAIGLGLSLASLRRGSDALGVVAGLIWGFAALIRPQAIFIAPFVLPALALNPSGRRSTYARLTAIQVVVAVAVIGPWVVRNRVVMGKAALGSTAGVTFWGAHNDVVYEDPALAGGWVRPLALFDDNHRFSGDEFAQDAQAWRYGIAWVKANPSRMPWLYFKKVTRLITPITLTENRAVFWAYAISWGVTGPLALLGLIVAFRRDQLAATVLALPLMGILLNCMIFYSNSRFRDSVSPSYVLFAAIGFLALIDAPRRLRAETTPGLAEDLHPLDRVAHAEP